MMLLPCGLAFAAGAMVFIVIEELVPECQQCGNADAAVLAAIIGFTLMTDARHRTGLSRTRVRVALRLVG